MTDQGAIDVFFLFLGAVSAWAVVVAWSRI